ncbi:MAG: DNA repair exonuclease [Clostridia bacterium]|nr:DNA repair exonuclease [Clostridia bacterium]
MAIRFFHTADLHIGAELSYLSGKAEERRFELLSAFKNIVDYCAENSVEICLISGDLFDSNLAAKDAAPSVFEYIKSAPNVRFFYVAGNHDPLDATSPMNSKILPDNLYVFGTDYEAVTLEALGVRIIGRSFAHSYMEPKEFNTVFSDDGLLNIMLLHADITSDKNSPYNPIDRDFIENSGLNYLALGHIHKRTAPATLGKTTFAYPGSPEGHGFDEEGIRGGYLVTLNEKNADVSFVRISKRAHRTIKIDVSNATSSITAAEIIINNLKENYGENFADNLYKIILTGYVLEGVTLKSAEILSILRTSLYYVKLQNQSRKAFDLDTLKEEVSLKGIFVKKMLDKINQAGEDKKELFKEALYIGLAAFDSEVAVNED